MLVARCVRNGKQRLWAALRAQRPLAAAAAAGPTDSEFGPLLGAMGLTVGTAAAFLDYQAAEFARAHPLDEHAPHDYGVVLVRVRNLLAETEVRITPNRTTARVGLVWRRAPLDGRLCDEPCVLESVDARGYQATLRGMYSHRLFTVNAYGPVPPTDDPRN